MSGTAKIFAFEIAFKKCTVCNPLLTAAVS